MTPALRHRRASASAAPPQPRASLLSRLFSRWANPSSVGPGIRFGGQCSAYRDSPYAGASRSRKQLSNWQPERWPADLELLPSYDLLVARSRDLDRNNGIASGAFQTLQDNTVGIGLRLAAKPDYRALGRDIAWSEDWSRQVESLWATWANSTACDAAGRMNFTSLTQLVFRASLQNGEALALPLWIERGDTPFKTCLQLVETDRLSNPYDQLTTPLLRGGVEMDIYGKPVAYHIQKQLSGAPLEVFAFISGGYPTLSAFGLLEWERIPAETDWGRKRVLHIYGQDRVDQTRGKPILAPIIEQFRMLDSYQRTELQSAIANSLVAGVITTPLDPAGINDMMGGDANRYLEQKNEYRPQMEGGTFIPLYPGDTMTPFTPSRPAPQFSSFVEAVLRQIGAAIGLPYELVLKDFSKTNYSSARAALLEAWRFFTARRNWLATYWAAPVYRLWLEEAVNAGMIDAPNFYEMMPYYLKAAWIGPGRGWIDPVKEAEAAQIRMATMVSTLELECAEQGLDWNEVLEQRALELERMNQMGLPPPQPLQSAPPPHEQEPGMPAQPAAMGALPGEEKPAKKPVYPPEEEEGEDEEDEEEDAPVKPEEEAA